MIAVSRVRDRAAAEVAKETLSAIGVPVEIKRLGGDAYFGSATPEAFEIRVPPEHEDAALAELDRLAEEMEQAAVVEAGVPASDDEDDHDDLHEEQPRRISWAIALGLLQPIPGAACMYAREFRVGLLVFTVACALFGAAAVGLYGAGLESWIAAKLIDLVLAPFFVVRYNRRLAARSAHAARS